MTLATTLFRALVLIGHRGPRGPGSPVTAWILVGAVVTFALVYFAVRAYGQRRRR